MLTQVNEKKKEKKKGENHNVEVYCYIAQQYIEAIFYFRGMRMTYFELEKKYPFHNEIA